jgi:5-methylcytosine-specific restriction endonuclease McrA
MGRFEEVSPSRESYWRAIILFGRNVASYKFALAKSLLELASNEATSISLDELAVPFSRHIREHLKSNEKQGTFASSKFLDACRKFNQGALSEDALLRETVSRGFHNVIDAFHVVNQGEIPVRFFTDERRNGNRIVITDELLSLKESMQFESLPHEAEARWRLVETAWTLNMSANLLSVLYDAEAGLLYVQAGDRRRMNVTSARGALNGYQKGKCFYCFSDILLDGGSSNLPDVDHFFPIALVQMFRSGYNAPINGVWNLVLACQRCNRGAMGKFTRVPALKYLERLHTRNSFLINSHHPLRETLMNQTGQTEEQRRSFLQEQYRQAKNLLIHEWQPTEEGEAAF